MTWQIVLLEQLEWSRYVGVVKLPGWSEQIFEGGHGNGILDYWAGRRFGSYVPDGSRFAEVSSEPLDIRAFRCELSILAGVGRVLNWSCPVFTRVRELHGERRAAR